MQYSIPNDQWEGAQSGCKPWLRYWKTRIATLVDVDRQRLLWLPSAAPMSCPLVLPRCGTQFGPSLLLGAPSCSLDAPPWQSKSSYKRADKESMMVIVERVRAASM